MAHPPTSKKKITHQLAKFLAIQTGAKHQLICSIYHVIVWLRHPFTF
jgi:hypothetical protein